jgi:hypothetical protein
VWKNLYKKGAESSKFQKTAEIIHKAPKIPAWKLFFAIQKKFKKTLKKTIVPRGT